MIPTIFQELNEKLANRLDYLCLELLGEPKTRTFHHWRYGRKGSLCVYFSGPYEGRFMDYETGENGNCLDLIKRTKSLKMGEVLEWSKNWLGEVKSPTNYSENYLRNSCLIENSKTLYERPKDFDFEGLQPLFPIPRDAPPFDLDSPPLNFMAKNGKLTGTYLYKTKDGDPFGYVLRFENKHGKLIPPLTYCKTKTGDCLWYFKGFGDNRPLYNLHDLFSRKEAPVLLVEGEKTANAASKLFPNHVVVTWSGGVGALKKTDFSPLKGRKITLFPDNDAPGMRAMMEIGDLLKTLKTPCLTIDIPQNFPPKWDLADSIEGLGVSYEELLLRTTVWG